MNGTWRIVSAVAITSLYVATGLIAERWWLALGDDIGLWGKQVAQLAVAKNFSWEPIVAALLPAVPSALIYLLNRSMLVHAWLFLICASQLQYGIHYLLYGAYFGCDRHGCSAEEGFLLGNVATAIFAVLGAAVIQIILWTVRDIRASRRAKKQLTSPTA